MKNMKEKKSRKFKILASVLGIVVGVSAIFAPACATKSVDDTYINDNGELIVVYTDGTQKNLGVVKGEDGKDGANGLDGKDGIDGVNGVDGKDGIDGADGTEERVPWSVDPVCERTIHGHGKCRVATDADFTIGQFAEGGHQCHYLSSASRG